MKNIALLATAAMTFASSPAFAAARPVRWDVAGPLAGLGAIVGAFVGALVTRRGRGTLAAAVIGACVGLLIGI